jgi:hypothetical protein
MHKSTFFITLLLTFFFLCFNNSYAQEGTEPHSFVGAEVCGPCHKTDKQGKQLEIWQNSPHSKAFQTLQTKEADEIAKNSGSNLPAAETEACLKCHTSGYNVDKALIGAKFKMTDGVQCETCHGPGSHYKSVKIMKDRAAATQNGLKIYEKPEELCITCHNSESPTFKSFEFSAMWEKIKHPVPGEK